jgi:hypothetical protein
MANEPAPPVPISPGWASPIAVSASSDSLNTVGRGPSCVSRRITETPSRKELNRHPS